MKGSDIRIRTLKFPEPALICPSTIGSYNTGSRYVCKLCWAYVLKKGFEPSVCAHHTNRMRFILNRGRSCPPCQTTIKIRSGLLSSSVPGWFHPSHGVPWKAYQLLSECLQPKPYLRYESPSLCIGKPSHLNDSGNHA